MKGNNGFGEASARYRYGGNGKVLAIYNNDCGKSLTSYGNIDHGKVLLDIVMSAMEAKVLLGVAVVATPTTHLLPLKERATKVVQRCTVARSVRTHSSAHPRHREATLLVITGSYRRRARQS
jgi:hypothetical protein